MLLDCATIFVNVVLPVFVLIGIGVALDRTLRPDVRTLSNLNFYVFVPALVFTRILESSLGLAEVARIGTASLALIGTMFALGRTACRLLPGLRPHGRVLAMSAAFFNSGNYGIPLAQLAFGDAGATIMAVFLMVQNFTSFTLGVCLYENHRSPLRFCRGLLSTPVILAIGLAALMRAWGLQLPMQAAIPLGHLAAGLIPIALLTLGVQLSRSLLARPYHPLAVAVVLKLLVAPCVALGLAVALGLRSLEMQVFVVGAGFPTAVNVYILASRYEEDAELASRIVFATTLLSAVTVSVLLALCRAWAA